MALRFNKRIKIAPGVKLNVSTKGVSTTVGARGASVNVGKRGAHANVGLPGTGLSSRTKIAGGKKSREVHDAPAPAKKSGEMFLFWVGVVTIIGVVIWLL
jgi:hypothetical protein